MRLKEFLKSKLSFVDSELKLDLEFLILETLKISKLNLHSLPTSLTEEQIQTLEVRIKELEKGVPLAYILNSQEFMGLNFFVDSRVLIPRPETEYMVDLCLKMSTSKMMKILDAGAGSGCIGISFLVLKPDSTCIFIEKSKLAIEVLNLNLKNHRIDPRRYMIFENFEDYENYNSDFEQKLDIFISNPPYIGEDDLTVENSVLMYEPSMALFAEEQGLSFLKNWSNKALKYLKVTNSFGIFEFGHDQQNALQSYANLMTIKSEIIKDQYEKPRFWKIYPS